MMEYPLCLAGLGLAGVLLSVVAVVIGGCIGDLIGGCIVLSVGVVNTILNSLPVCIGFIGVYAEVTTEVLIGLCIVFYILVLPNICGLGCISFGLMGDKADGTYSRIYFISLIIIYLAEMIVSGVYLADILNRKDEYTLVME